MSASSRTHSHGQAKRRRTLANRTALSASVAAWPGFAGSRCYSCKSATSGTMNLQKVHFGSCSESVLSYLFRGAGKPEKGAENDKQVEGDRTFSRRSDRHWRDVFKCGISHARCSSGRASACREHNDSRFLARRLGTGLGLASRVGSRLGLLPGLGTGLGTRILRLRLGLATQLVLLASARLRLVVGMNAVAGIGWPPLAQLI